MASKPREVRGEYSFCKSLVYSIQAITRQKTHEILATLVSKADEVIAANEIDVTTKSITDSWCSEISCRDYIFYPGTKMYLGIYVRIYGSRKNPSSWSSPVINVVSYSFKLPQSYVRMTQQEFDDIAVDGMLTDSSFDFDKPTIKRPKTPAEQKKEREEKAALAKAKKEAKLAAKEARKIP